MFIPPQVNGKYLKPNPPLKTFANLMPNMKTPLPHSIQSALAEVAAIADQLAATACDFPSAKLGDMNVTGILDNLDFVAACLTLDELENAPAMLNAAARAFRQTFPGMSDGFAAAGRLQTIAYAIELEQTAAAAETAVCKAETLHGWQSIEAADARSFYQYAKGKASAFSAQA